MDSTCPEADSKPDRARFSEKDTELPSRNNLEEFGYILSTSTPIVEHTLKWLSAKDLNTCARVCQLWNSVAKRLKKRRKEIVTCFHVASSNPHLIAEVYGAGSISGRAEDDQLALSYLLCHTDAEVGENFNTVMSSVSSQPSVGLIFSTERLLEKPDKYFGRLYSTGYSKAGGNNGSPIMQIKKPRTTPLLDYLARCVPKSCSLLLCSCPGIIGTPCDNQAPLEIEHYEGLSGIFFPKLPGVEFYPFNVTELNVSEMLEKPSLSPTVVEQITGIPVNKKIKCLLMFLPEPAHESTVYGSFIHYFLSKESMKLALGGAVVDDLFASFKSNESWSACTGLAIAGEFVSAASIVIPSNMKSEKQIGDKLQDMKNSGISLENAVGLMFVCCGRGVSFHQRSNVEANLFHKYFPNVPLFGLFGNGEVGQNYLPNSPRDPNSRKKDSFAHVFSTVFVLLSLGRV